jgi:hypothetical protein
MLHLLTDNATLRGFNFAIRLGAMASAFFLPLGQFLATYALLGWLANIIAQRTEFKVKMAMQQWPWLFYVQFVSVPLVGYGFYSLVHFFI